MDQNTAFKLPTDAEEDAELAALTGALEKPTGDPELDAVASDALRIMIREARELERYRLSMENEISRIERRYATLGQPHKNRLLSAEDLVKECARRAQFPGKAKSRKVGYGTYGRKQKPEKVEIIDKEKLIGWLRVKDPSIIKTVTEEKVYLQDLKPVVIKHIVENEGEVPPGIEHHEATDEPFAKPLSETE